jgi:hypothetical protein
MISTPDFPVLATPWPPNAAPNTRPPGTQKRHRLGPALADGVMLADVYRPTDAEMVDQLEAAAAQLAEIQAKLLSSWISDSLGYLN